MTTSISTKVNHERIKVREIKILVCANMRGENDFSRTSAMYQDMWWYFSEIIVLCRFKGDVSCKDRSASCLMMIGGDHVLVRETSLLSLFVSCVSCIFCDKCLSINQVDHVLLPCDFTYFIPCKTILREWNEAISWHTGEDVAVSFVKDEFHRFFGKECCLCAMVLVDSGRHIGCDAL